MAPERTRVAYSGLDVERFANPGPGARERVRAELSLDSDQPLLVVPGRLSRDPEKGQITAIRAFAGLVADLPTARMCLVGDGPAREECEGLVRSLGLSARVRLLGQRADLPAVLAAADVVLVPSDCNDAFPYTALEAMCARRPVVASRDGGLIEILDGGRRGILVEPRDSVGFARASKRLLEEPALAKHLVEQAFAFARELTFQRHIEELTTLYSELAPALRASPRRDTMRSSL
jgi:glycosyltransferase involved in cell wall biosynthesis